MIPMPQLSVEDDVSQLNHLAQRLAHWRQNRPSPKARIPKAFWEEAVSLTLTSQLSASRVAKHLGLCTADLKKHVPLSAPVTSRPPSNPSIPFIDVTPATPWLRPEVEVDLKRADGSHLHIAYHNGASGLSDLVRAFLEPH